MDTNSLNENEKLTLNAYFQDSRDSDIFDQISQLNFADCDKTVIDDSAFSVAASQLHADSRQSQSETVICKIFASEDVDHSATETQDIKFFDMLADNTKYSTRTDTLLTSGLTPSFNPILSPEPPSDGSFFSPSSGTDIDSDAVNDEMFLKGTAGTIPSSSIISTSELDRRRDAWIPSSRTRQALIAAATATPGTYVLDKELQTMPGVVLQEDMVDNVHEAVNHYLGEIEAAQRNVLSLNDVTQDERGLRELIQAECYRAAVNLTSRLLTMYGQGIGRSGYASKHTLHSIQLWFTRIALLVKLRSWSVAWAESEPWWDLDKPDLYFQFYSELYGGRPGTIVPFSFRLLLAELPQYVHKPQEALKRLFSTLSVVRKILRNLDNHLSEDGSHIELTDSDRMESKKLWKSRETRILFSIVNLTFQQKDYRISIDVLQGLIDSPDMQQSVYHRRALLSALGRIYLQLGDLKGAEKWFEKSCSLKSSSQAKPSPDFQELVDRGLLALADSDYEKAYDHFRRASMKDPTNIMVKNNMAVCLLYRGKQKEAVKLLEAVISTNPTSGLHESLLLNLCTLYELESSTSMENKYKMLKLVSKYKGDAISLHCLKLQIKE